MNWEEIIMSALKGEEDLKIALEKAAEVAPKEISSVLKNFPEETEEISELIMKPDMSENILSLLYYHFFSTIGGFFNYFPYKQQKYILRVSINASLKASYISGLLGERILEVRYLLKAADSFYRLCEFSEAEKVYREALEKYRSLAREDPEAYTPYIAGTLNNLGALYRDTGKFSEAEKVYREALEIERSLAREDPEAYAPDIAMILCNLGALYRDTQKFSEAEKVYREALEIERSLAREDPEAYTPYIAGTLNNLGALYRDTQKFSEAEKVYREALEKYRSLAREDPEAYTPEIAVTLNNLGVLYMNSEEFSKAEKIYNEVLEKYKETDLWFHAAKTAHDLSKIKYDKEILENSRKLLEMAILFSKDKKYKYAQERAHESIYLSFLEKDISPFGVLEALRDPELLSLQWDRILSRSELKRAQQDVEFQKILVEMVLKTQISLYELIPAKLSETSIFIYIQELRDHILFFILEDNSIKKVICEKKFLLLGNKLLHNLRMQQWAAERAHDMTFVIKKFEMISDQWFETLPQELRTLIQGKEYVVFSPDYSCSFLPLEALNIYGHPLCIEKTVVRATSYHQLLALLRKKPNFESSLIVGNPWPHCNKKKLIYSSPQKDSGRFKISFLNSAEEEAKVLMTLLPKPTLLLTQEATGERFLSEVTRHSLVHFSGHGSLGRILFLSGPLKGFPPPFEPEEFSDLRKAERIEGTRRTNMMQDWHPVTDLDLFELELVDGAIVFLNASETGQFKYAGGYCEGLSAIFLKNGAHSVISSLVPIFDEPSKEFAIRFYENLLDTHSVAKALKKARIWAKDNHEAQIYWIPYLHYGSPL